MALKPGDKVWVLARNLKVILKQSHWGIVEDSVILPFVVVETIVYYMTTGRDDEVTSYTVGWWDKGGVGSYGELAIMPLADLYETKAEADTACAELWSSLEKFRKEGLTCKGNVRARPV